MALARCCAIFAMRNRRWAAPGEELSAMERLNRHVLRKSLAATQAIPAGRAHPAMIK